MSATHARLQPPTRLLMGPGPSPIEPRVYEALAKPAVGHLDPYLFDVVEEVQALLRTVFGTANEMTIAVSGTGTSSMEAAISNFVEPASSVAVLVNGYFGERLADMAGRQGAAVLRLEKPWGEAFEDSEAAEFIAQAEPDIVAFVHGETSTGVLQRGEAVCEAAHEVGALVIADTVTTLGNVPVGADQTGIDIAYSCSQKGLGCVSGLAPLTVSPRAMERLGRRESVNRSFYLDLGLLAEYWFGRKYHHTASSSLFYALREALTAIDEEGLDDRFARITANHHAFVAGIEAMGMGMKVAAPHRLPPLNTVLVPDGVSDAAVRRRLLDDRGIEIAGGFGPLAGAIFRIGVMGSGSTRENVLLLLDALREALEAEGFHPEGDGVAAAEAFYAGG